MRTVEKALTAVAVDKAKVPEGVAYLDLRDGSVPGLMLRKFAAGRREWRFRYTSPTGKRREATLGELCDGGLDFASARSKARNYREALREGRDPLEEKAAAKAAARAAAAGTVASLLKLYLRRHASKKRPKGRAGDERQAATVEARWGRRPAREISRRDVVELLEDVRDQRGPIAANRMQAFLHGVFTFGMRRETVPANPVSGLRRLHREIPRDRVLTDEELRRVWVACDGLGKITGTVYQVMLATGQRGGEVCSMAWADLEDRPDGRWWKLPAQIRKTGRAHEIPLSELAVDLVETLRPVTGSTPWVFTILETKPLAWISHASARLRKASDTAGWTPHDLRRTAATLLGDAGTAPHIIEALLGHARSRLEETYQRSRRAGELRRAVQVLAAELRAILAGEQRQGGDVLPFARKAT